MAQYNLTDNVATSWNFMLGELEYNFRYPTTREMKAIGQLNADLKKLVEDKATDEVIAEKGKESEKKMDELVTPVGHENAIGDVLEDQPINVVRNFRSMMAKELSLE